MIYTYVDALLSNSKEHYFDQIYNIITIINIYKVLSFRILIPGLLFASSSGDCDGDEGRGGGGGAGGTCALFGGGGV
ncbi:hypothetical protein ACFX2F_022315 [Malus domestica]